MKILIHNDKNYSLKDITVQKSFGRADNMGRPSIHKLSDVMQIDNNEYDAETLLDKIVDYGMRQIDTSEISIFNRSHVLLDDIIMCKVTYSDHVIESEQEYIEVIKINLPT